jgi:translation initiation factor IF-2
VEQVNVREQDRLARQLRGNIQSQLERRRLLVERQSREQSRRRRPASTGRKAAPARERKRKILRVAGPASFQELSRGLGVKVQELLRRAQALDPEVDRDALVDLETAELLASDLGFEVQVTTPDVEKELAAAETAEEDQEPRPPVVTVMGHVDHGKTSLLDYIRSTKVAEGEAGGITQHIGAYSVEAGGSTITFLDTPGHAAFTQMRARGAQVTDIAVLVVAADDGVMPQTVEAISHARAAGVPIIVAVNKIDLPDANPQRVKQGLLEQELVPEELGGETICVEVSAKAGTHVDKLLEMLALQSEVLELKARRKGSARGVVIEAQLDRGRGPVATVLVNEGTLEHGDALVVGTTWGRVRALSNHKGEPVKQALPSDAVQIVGLQAVPEAGDEFIVTKNEREAKQVADHRVDEQRRPVAAVGGDLLDADVLFAQLDETDKKQLAVILKADVRGTVEAARDSLQELSTDRVKLEVIHAGVGAINESDIDLASASNALIVGFNVRPEPAARKTAERDGVEVRTFEVIHEMLDEVKAAMTGLLPPKRVERVRGHAEVRKLFTIPKVGTIAGCLVPDGGVHRSDMIRVVRDGVVVYTSKISSLRHYKDDAREIQSGSECGIGVENFNDVKVGDILEAFVVEETADTL